MKPAWVRCKAVAEGKVWCAFLHGGYGTGKTHLAIAALSRFGRGMFQKVPDLLDWVRAAAYDPGGVGIEAALSRYRGMSGLLVLDDLGTENATGWAEEQLYRILDSRYESRLPTIITSNQDYSRTDGRIKSRFGEGLIICKGLDVRLEAKANA